MHCFPCLECEATSYAIQMGEYLFFDSNGLEISKFSHLAGRGDPKTVINSYYKSGATSYLVKPVGREELLDEIRNLGLIS